jgi:hypothetical protein
MVYHGCSQCDDEIALTGGKQFAYCSNRYIPAILPPIRNPCIRLIVQQFNRRNLPQDKFLTKRRVKDPTGRLLAMSDGARIVTLIDQLDAALREARLERSSFGEKYSIYSFRHFYAVNALRSGIGVFEVARNPRTAGQCVPVSHRL